MCLVHHIYDVDGLVEKIKYLLIHLNISKTTNQFLLQHTHHQV
jgi:hypothetical protein